MDRRVEETLRLLEASNVNSHLPPPPLDDLAKSLGLSRSRLRHIFRDATGVSPGHFLLALRLGRAKQLLESSHLSVKQAMAEIGMSNESSFIRTFKKVYGVTPGYYRSHVAAKTPVVASPPHRSQKSTK